MNIKRIETRRKIRIVTGVATCILVAAVLFGIGQDQGRGDELWLSGRPNSPVRLEVFSDYQCPHCRAFYLDTIKPLIAGLTKENKADEVYIVYHDLPLDMHQYARKAARYALAAERLGREAWLRVADALYQEQATWALDGNIESVISKVLNEGDAVRVRNLVSDPAIEQAIRNEITLAHSRQVKATPTFFILTQTGRQQRVNGVVPYDLLKGHLDNFLR